ncbi:MAG: hypothetical protein AB1772_08340 [Candidatus Zixiibacteriota bacterium]
MKSSYYSLVSRLFFFAAGILLLLAVWDWVLGWFGYRMTWLPYQPGRLLEFAAILVIFVMALLLRQIRDQLKQK